MNFFNQQLLSLSKTSVPILDDSIPLEAYVPIDLSVDNGDLKHLNIADPDICQVYIDNVLYSKVGKVAYGGYLEKRNLYGDKASFSDGSANRRDIHLGIDYWSVAGTRVVAPITGAVHSFKNNADIGDYGPTIILEHKVNGIIFYTLYGHLSIASLDGLTVGKVYRKGEVLAALGTPDINVNYAPHLHFQIIKDLEGFSGDYPGVCSRDNLGFYRENCPDPNLLLKIGG